MAKLRAAEATHQDYENIDDSTPISGLFAPGGPFESFPGAAVVVGRNGIVLGANQGAGPLLRLLRGDAPAELREGRVIDNITQQQNAFLTDQSGLDEFLSNRGGLGFTGIPGANGCR